MILRNTNAQIKVTLTVDETDTNPSPDSATVQVLRENGSTLVAETAATDGGTGIFTYQLTATHTALLDVLTARWKMTVGGVQQILETKHEVVGGFLVSLKELRAKLPANINPSPSTDDLAAARWLAETRLEDLCAVAFRPRYARETFDGAGATDILLSRPRPLSIRAVTVDDVALTSDELAELEISQSGVLHRPSAWSRGTQNVAVTYEHGYPNPPPAVSRAALRFARSLVIADPSNYDERATRIETDEASYSLVTPGVRGAHTTIPEVNAVIAEYGYVGVG